MFSFVVLVLSYHDSLLSHVNMYLEKLKTLLGKFSILTTTEFWLKNANRMRLMSKSCNWSPSAAHGYSIKINQFRIQKLTNWALYVQTGLLSQCPVHIPRNSQTITSWSVGYTVLLWLRCAFSSHGNNSHVYRGYQHPVNHAHMLPLDIESCLNLHTLFIL